jgi:predicted transcriptional regulator
VENDSYILDNSHERNEDQMDLVALTADIVSAYVSNNRVPSVEMPALLSSVHAAITGLGNAPASVEPPPVKPTPAQIRKSITPDALISFIDGRPYKTLKRHLAGNGMTIEDYRERFGLPRDYPSTAANYSAMRAEFARSSRLGHQRRAAVPKATEAAETISRAPEASVASPANKPSKARKTKKATSSADAG